MYQNNQYESIGNQFNHIYKYTHNPPHKKIPPKPKGFQNYLR